MNHLLIPLAQASYTRTYNNNSGNGIASSIVALIELALFVVVIAGMWKVFVKAGRPGWAAIIPIYNVYVFTKLAGRPGWWLILFLIPLVSIVMLVIIGIDIAKRFGKGTGFGVGLSLLGFIFFPILGFGDAVYQPAIGEGRGFEVIQS